MSAATPSGSGSPALARQQAARLAAGPRCTHRTDRRGHGQALHSRCTASSAGRSRHGSPRSLATSPRWKPQVDARGLLRCKSIDHLTAHEPVTPEPHAGPLASDQALANRLAAEAKAAPDLRCSHPLVRLLGGGEQGGPTSRGLGGSCGGPSPGASGVARDPLLSTELGAPRPGQARYLGLPGWDTHDAPRSRFRRRDRADFAASPAK
jgi:hypothetical protein